LLSLTGSLFGSAGRDLLVAVEVYEFEVVHSVAFIWVNVMLLDFELVISTEPSDAYTS
jgi:hypothetical protein